MGRAWRTTGPRLAVVVGVGLGVAGVAPAPAHGQSQAVPDTVAGSVAGTVRGTFRGHTDVLPWAVIDASTSTTRRMAVSDSLGRYRLNGLPPGLVRVRVSHVGHAPMTMEVMVLPGTTVSLDVDLETQPLPLPPLEVVASRSLPDSARPQLEPAAARTVQAAALEAGAGVADAGLVDVVRSLSGSDPTDANDVLLMRGTTTDLKLVLLDGAPVYAPFHVAGLMRSFDPDVLGSAKLLLGGAPARYEGGLSYILDLHTRQPGRERIQGSGSLDLLSAAGEVDGPIGRKAGFLASARTLHDLGAPVFEGSSPYGYHDALLRTGVEIAPGHAIRATGFWNRESVALDLARTQGVSAGDAPPDAWWSNRAVSAVYHGTIGRALLDITAAAGGYRASLPLQPSARAGQPQPDLLLATGATSRTRLLAEVSLPDSHGMTRAGLSWDGLQAAYEARSFGSSVSTATMRGRGSMAGAYVDVKRSFGPEVSVRAGLRADAFSGDHDGVRLAPRASVAWTVGPDAVVTVAAGRYHQYARATDAVLDSTIGYAVGAAFPAKEPLPVATADHVVLSLDQMLGKRVRFGLDGFWKRYQGLQSADGGTVRNSGVDLNIRREGDEAMVWLGYRLSWFWSTNDLSGPTSEFVGRQLLTMGISGRLGGPFRGELQIAYAAGLPYTAVPYSASDPTALENPDGGDVTTQSPPLSGGAEQEFLRVDAELNAPLQARWHGRSWHITPYLRILNALDRRDALFYAFSRYRDPSLRPLASQPLIPVLGVSWRF